MKIARIALFSIGFPWEEDTPQTESRQATSLDIYPEYNLVHFSMKPKKGDAVEFLFVEIETSSGEKGHFGPIDNQQAFIIQSQLAPFLLNKDPLATEKVHDQMIRLNRHGRSGLFMTAISAIDLALWDLRGKILNLPVYRLLGGPTREKIPAYASMLGNSIDPQKAAVSALEMKNQGYKAQKWFFRYGPADGAEGMAKNMALAHSIREVVGEEYPIAFDAYNGWDEPYAIAILRRLEAVHPLWVEEAIPPERVGSFAKIRASTAVPLATGEHVYTRWQVKELLAQSAIDFVQTDPDWGGGISEQVKICSLASAFNVPVIAHGHSLLPAIHVAASQSAETVPYVEYLVNLQDAKRNLFASPCAPVNGQFQLPDRPGLGLDIRDEMMLRRKNFIWQRTNSDG